MNDTLSALAPATEAELSALITDRFRSCAPLRIAGGGTRTDTAHLDGDLLSTARLSGVVDYAPGEMTLIARAGTPLDQITRMLQAEGQALAFEPPDLRHVLGRNGTPTLGGMIASNATGPRRIQIGACRDHVLGLRFVDGQGRVIKTGGRVMKNVTGLDLAKLHCGGHGTLGVVTEIAIKTLPSLPARNSLGFHGVEAAQAVAIFARALSTPFEVSGAAWRDGTAWLRVEGLAPQMAYRRDRLLDLFRPADIEVLDDQASTGLWRDLRDLSHFSASDAPLWRIMAKPSDAPGVIAALAGSGGQVSLDWGGGVIFYAGSAPAEALRQAALPGHATLLRRAGAQARAFSPEAPAIADLSHRLRQTFDPAGILNPGLMDS